MLLKYTADGRRIKVNGSTTVTQGNVARGMKMTMSTSATMSPRVHRKVIRAPHKRTHQGKIAHPGKIPHPGKMTYPGKMALHPGKLGKFGKLGHYAHTHGIRPPEPCDNSNDSGLGPDPVHRLSDSIEDWEPSGPKRPRYDSAVKLESDDANAEYAFPSLPLPTTMPLSTSAGFPPTSEVPSVAVGLPPVATSLLPAQDIIPLPELPAPTPMCASVIRAGCSISSPNIIETTGKRLTDPSYRSCGNFGSGKLANKYAGGGKLSGGKLSGKGGGKLGGKYGGKLAQVLARRRALAAMSGPPGLSAPLTCRSRDGKVELQILCQPETQHRARYQTEGSRGAVKDNSGNGFPIVKLVGYDKPAVLQVFIGTDTGRVAPHMFYQACRVSGKNSTPCKERKEDGTVVIEIELEPTKNWQVVCDCVGILKERNVDVEHRFGETLGGGAHVSRGKKKSTRCRMVFRADILNAEGTPETLQVCSTQIICTQPPGVPEVCRKSLVSSPAPGGLELYLLGKNFLKETKVVFCQRHDGHTSWEEEVAPDKEFLQQTHLVCCVPPYLRTDINEPVQVQLFVRSGGKASEPHNFYYTPSAHDSGPLHCTRHHTQGEPPWGTTLKSEAEDSQGAVGPGAGQVSPVSREDLVVDLRLKAEARDSPYGYDAMKLSPPTPSQTDSPSPIACFTQQLQAMHTQVQTDKMVETVTAAIFNDNGPANQIYVDRPILPMQQLQSDAMSQLISTKNMMDPMQSEPMPQPPSQEAFNPFGTITKMEMEDVMKATAAMLPADTPNLDALVNARADVHLSGGGHMSGGQTPTSEGTSPALASSAILDPQVSPAMLANSPQEELMMMQEMSTAVKTPPAAVKSMILNAAAEILTSDSAMNALVTSAINTANILSTENGGTTVEPPAEPAAEAPLAAMSQAVSQAVTQAVSQAVSHAVSQAVSQEMTAPVQGLTDMSDQDLLSYINPSTFDQV